MVQTGNFISTIQNYNHRRLLPGQGKIVKRWPVRGWKKVRELQGISCKHLLSI